MGKQYLATNEIISLNYALHVPSVYVTNDFCFDHGFDEIILHPLRQYYDVMISMQNEEKIIKILGDKHNVHFANKALQRFCNNIRGTFVDEKCKGLLIQRFLHKFR